MKNINNFRLYCINQYKKRYFEYLKSYFSNSCEFQFFEKHERDSDKSIRLVLINFLLEMKQTAKRLTVSRFKELTERRKLVDLYFQI